MIDLFKFKPAADLPDPSPFCMKVETFLKMAQMDYENVEINDPRKGPKGKLPFIQDGTTVIGDSSLIIDYLTDKYKPDIDKLLSAQQAAVGYCITKMLEEHFYWIVVYSRWIDDRSWPGVRDMLFASVPQPLRSVIAGFFRHRVKRTLYGQGIGRHTSEEIYAMGRRDLQAVSDILDENDFILGERPSSFDCSVHAFVAGAIQCSFDTPLKTSGRALPNLVEYNDRMNALYYSS
jgi:glutathione S-transferase